MDSEEAKLEALKQRFVKVEISFENPKWVLLYDTKEKHWIQVWNKEELERLNKEGGGGYYKKCSGMCGLTQLRRPHFTCLTKCRLKKVLEGKIPLVDPVWPTTFMIRRNLPLWRLWIAKKVASFYEWLIT